MSGPRRLILHVGPHKTGSTYLQMGFKINQALLEREGIYHPPAEDMGERFNRIIDRLRWQRSESEIAEILAPMLELCRERETVLLSSENFAHATPQSLSQFRDMLGAREVSVIYYIRGLHGLWPSSWQEQVKHGADTSFEEYLLAAGGSADAPRNVPQRLQIGRLAEVFGRDALRLFVYDNLMSAGRDIFEGFVADVLGLDPAGFERPGRDLNKSFTPIRVEMIRCLNMLQLRQPDAPRRIGDGLRLSYMRNVRRIERGPVFAAFREAFNAFAKTVTVAADHPFVLHNSHALLQDYGDRIVDLPAPDSLFVDPPAPRAVRSCSRYWLHASPVMAEVEEIRAQLSG